MRLRNQRLTVILVPQGGAKTYTFQVRVDLLVGLGALLVVLLAVSTTLVFTYGRLLSAARAKEETERRMAKLQDELATVHDLQLKVAENERFRAKVMEILGGRRASLDTLTPSSGATAATAVAPEDAPTRAHDFASAVPRSWPVRGPVTLGFQAGTKEAGSYHPGIDIAAATGTPVLAAAPGTVSFAGWDKEYGYLVVLEHGLGFETRYGHNVRLSVRVGERVERGQLIAAVGSTGRSTAPHLHFEILKDGNPVDPGQYLP